MESSHVSQQVYVSYERIRDNRFMFLTKELETKWVCVREYSGKEA